MTSNFLIFVGLAYLVALAAFCFYIKRLQFGFLRLGRSVLGIAVALHFGFLVSWLRYRQIFVPSNSLESQLLILALLGFSCWLLSARKSLIYIVVMGLPFIVGGLAFFHFFASDTAPFILPDPWIWTHIILAVFGEAFFVLCALLSAVYLWVDFQLRQRLVNSAFSRLPSLADFDRILGENLLVGFVLLTLGLVMGLFFAAEHWDGSWWLDPKVIFAVLTWIFYAVLLSLRTFLSIFRGRRSAVWAVAGFIVILFLSLGMDWWLPSERHSVRGDSSQMDRP